jgi:diadenosine tetraphosphate (Ap4A) HIT family hydrolase
MGRAQSSTVECALCVGADPSIRSPMAELLPPDQSRFIAMTPNFVAMPTYGCFVAGYLLIVPRAHVLSFGCLGTDALAEAQDLMDSLAERLHAVYGSPVLGFEYGINATGVRRVEHAHWHLLPSEVALGQWLGERLDGQPLSLLTQLPGGEGSYIAVRNQHAALTVYDVGEATEAHQRIRLRRAVAALDPRVDEAAWDWADQRHTELIRATVTDLAVAGEGAAL